LIKALFHKDSTTKLNTNGDINLLQDELNKALIEKFNGNVELPPFPGEEDLLNTAENKH